MIRRLGRRPGQLHCLGRLIGSGALTELDAAFLASFSLSASAGLADEAADAALFAAFSAARPAFTLACVDSGRSNHSLSL
jgi:hypothetical protein